MIKWPRAPTVFSSLSDMNSQYGEILCHTQVRWLSRGKVIQRLFAFWEEIGRSWQWKEKIFLNLPTPNRF